jgi:hypothetical protein
LPTALPGIKTATLSVDSEAHVIMDSGLITFFVWVFVILGAGIVVLHVLTIVFGLRGSRRRPSDEDHARVDGQ